MRLISYTRRRSPTNAEARLVGALRCCVSHLWQSKAVLLLACERAGRGFVAVPGKPTYYKWFGFARARHRGPGDTYGVDEACVVWELRPGGIPTDAGIVSYAPGFAALNSVTAQNA